MINNKLNLLSSIISFTIISMSSLSAVCVDSEGISGQSCDMIVNTFGMTCDGEFAGSSISEAF